MQFFLTKEKNDKKVISQNVSKCYFWGTESISIFVHVFLYFPTLVNCIITLQSGKKKGYF